MKNSVSQTLFLLAKHIRRKLRIKSKQPKSSTDRISNLPDDLIFHILSFLPTKYAVATSILSTRWTRLYIFVPDINLDKALRQDYSDLETWHESQINSDIVRSFKNFLHSRLVLLPTNDAPRIHRFHLREGVTFDNSDIDMWICAALERGVQELDIRVSRAVSNHLENFEDGVPLPLGIFSCKTLVVLKMSRNSTLSIPCSVTLPCLKVLHLRFVKIVDVDSIRRVLSGCHVLEELRLFECSYGINIIDISIPSLKILRIFDSALGSYELALDTPNLEEYFYCVGRIGNGNHFMKGTNSIKRVHIDTVVNNPFVDSAARLINQISNVKSLSLSFHTLMALCISRSRLLTFLNLTEMILGGLSMFWWRLLPELLESSPNLEVLVFLEGFQDSDREIEEHGVHFPVPVCLSLHLREVEFNNFYGTKCEYELVKYFLKTGGVLEKMIIGLWESPKWLSSASIKLSKFPKCSKRCQIMRTRTLSPSA